MGADRLTVLDGLRGFAALCVVVCHYNFLTATGVDPSSAKEWLLAIFRDYGFHAVELFWVISGYIFTRLYCMDRTAGTREFVVNRFARLYPLHIVTLLTMVVLQYCATQTFGHQVFNQNNNVYHFVLQIFLAASWGWHDGPSFNYVIWSVSVEVVAYAVFWILRDWLKARRAPGALLVALLSGAVVLTGPPTFIFACCFYYFFGCAIAFASADLAGRPHGDAPLIGGLAIVGAAALASGNPILSTSLGLACTAGALVLLAIRAEAVCGSRMRRAAEWLGECSYGIYLWHVPFQLALFLVLAPRLSVPALALQGWFMALYFIGLLAIARASYLMIECPARAHLRRLARSGKEMRADAAEINRGDNPLPIR